MIKDIILEDLLVRGKWDNTFMDEDLFYCVLENIKPTSGTKESEDISLF